MIVQADQPLLDNSLRTNVDAVKRLGFIVAMLLLAAGTPATAAPNQITERDGSAFSLTPDWSLDTQAAGLASTLGSRLPVSDVLAAANRSTNDCSTSRKQAQPEFYDRTDIPLQANQILRSSDRFCWDDSDSKVSYWVPQGVTGSSDADDDGQWGPNKVMAVSWHYDTAKAGTPTDHGARLSLVDRVSGKYRHVLLVEPTSSSNFRAVPIHAGGLAWLGRYLYVADTSRGLRVFDMERVLEVATDQDGVIGKSGSKYYAYGYRYVVPQVATYRQAITPPSPCVPQPNALCYSSLALDRSTTPDTLVVGEYQDGRSTDLSIDGGRVVHYDVDASTRKLAVSSGKAVPSRAVTTPKSNVQGAQTWQGDYYLGRSSADKHSFMFAGSADMKTYSWAVGGEDLYYEHGSGLLWTATEHAFNAAGTLIDKRVVFAVPLAGIVP
jgi:hypothetical protein